MLNEALYLAMAGKGGTKPTGNIPITDTQVTDVAAYATAQVVDANLVAENIKDGVEVLGITGTFKGGSTPPETPTDALLFYSPNEIGLRTNNRLKNWEGTLYYSTDHTNWTEWDGTTEIVSALSDGYHKIYLRGVENYRISGPLQESGSFVCSGYPIKCVGNCTTLLNYLSPPSMIGSYAFSYLFYGCGNIDFDVTLPAVELGERSCEYMFAWCTSLVKPPVISAECYGAYCCSNMFTRCSSLKTPPAINATSLNSYSCSNMFNGCNSLESLPLLSVTTLKSQCYNSMFYGCKGIKLSTEQTGEYQNEYRIPASGTGTDASGALNSMFSNTGGTFTGTPTINTTYYTSNTVIPAT